MSLAKSSDLCRISVTIAPQAEEALVEWMTQIFGAPPGIYIDEESRTTTVSIYVKRNKTTNRKQVTRIREGLGVIRECGLLPEPARVSVSKVRHEDWAESWKRHFRPIEIGRQLLIKPTWSRRRPKRHQAVVLLDPGLSFGTGHHPTTSYCLRQLFLCRRRKRAQAFLDMGTGSGILAIAAVKLGYAPVVAFDFDPAAVRVAQENAKLNEVEKTIAFSRQDLLRLPVKSRTRYDVICANLIDDLLVEQRGKIIHRLAPGGSLILAGILHSQFSKVEEAYRSAGMKLAHQRREKEWQSGRFIFEA